MFFLLLIVAVSIAACGRQETAQRDGLQDNNISVATSLPVLGSILQELVLHDDQVKILLSGKESPHDYRPRASGIKLLADADV